MGAKKRILFDLEDIAAVRLTCKKCQIEVRYTAAKFGYGPQYCPTPNCSEWRRREYTRKEPTLIDVVSELMRRTQQEQNEEQAEDTLPVTVGFELKR